MALNYAEPTDYFPEDLLKEYKLGSYAEDEDEEQFANKTEENQDVSKEAEDNTNKE